MSRTRAFDAEKMDPAVKADVITFTLADQEFQCRATLPSWLLLKFAAISGEKGQGSEARALFSFFEDVLLPESLVRFESMVSGDDYVIEMETLGQISSWLVEEYTKRPTQPPSSSSPGAGATGTTSKESVDTKE